LTNTPSRYSNRTLPIRRRNPSSVRRGTSPIRLIFRSAPGPIHSNQNAGPRPADFSAVILKTEVSDSGRFDHLHRISVPEGLFPPGSHFRKGSPPRSLRGFRDLSTPGPRSLNEGESRNPGVECKDGAQNNTRFGNVEFGQRLGVGAVQGKENKKKAGGESD